MTMAAASSSRSFQLSVWLGERMMTSWMPLASACTWTGPRLWTAIESSPSNAGYRLGTTRTCHAPSRRCVSSAGGVASSEPGQKGQARVGSASTCWLRGAKSYGRLARSATMVTHRPFRGFSLSWLTVLPS